MPEGGIVKVLVVDDEKVIRDFLSRLLTLQSVSVKAVDSGMAALAAVKEEKFDLIFLDVRMPNMNGVEAFKELQKISPDSKYVIMTGYAVDDLLEDAKKLGAFNFMRKPFDINEINRLVKDYAVKGDGVKVIDILVVDDDRSIAAFFEKLLKDKSCNTTVVDTGKEALELIKARNFNLVFLDIILKDGNGTDFYLKIKEIKPNLDVVLMTGYSDKALGVDKLNIKGCLYKPFEINTIIQEIDKARGKNNSTKSG